MNTQAQVQTQAQAQARNVKFTQSFKTRDGFKRPNVQVEFELPAFQEINPSIAEKIIEHSLIQYAKKLFIENAENLEYIPASEEITVDALYESITAPSKRGQRFLTAEKIKLWAVKFASLATSAGKSQSYIETVQKIAEGKFKILVGQNERIEKLAEFLASLEFHPADSIESQVNDKFVEILAEMLEEKKEEITLESLD